MSCFYFESVSLPVLVVVCSFSQSDGPVGVAAALPTINLTGVTRGRGVLTHREDGTPEGAEPEPRQPRGGEANRSSVSVAAGSHGVNR